MDISYLIRALIHRKWIIIVAVVFSLIAAFVLTLGAKKEYISTAQLSTGFTVSEEMKLSDEKFNIQQIDVKFNNAIENIMSPRVTSLVSYNLMLHDLQTKPAFTTLEKSELQSKEYRSINPKDAILILSAKLSSVQLLSSSNPTEKALLKYIELYKYDPESLLKKLQIARFQRSDYINIVCSSDNPYLSAFVVNTLCKEFKRFYGLDKRERTDGSVLSLDTFVRQKKMLLDAKIAEKNKFMTAEGVVDVNLEGSNKLGQISSLETLLIDEKGTFQNMSYRVNELTTLINSARAKGLSTVRTSGNGNSADNIEYVRLKKQYKDVYNQYMQKGSNDPKLKRQVDSITQAMARLNLGDGNQVEGTAGIVSVDELVQKRLDAEAQMRASSQKISAIQTKLNQLNGGLSSMAAKGADIQQLNKEIEMASTEYTDATNRFNMATNMNENVQGTFKQTILGEPALSPEPSKRLIVMALSGVSAFFLSSIVILSLAFFDKSIKTPSNFLRQIDLPLLGIVNFVKFKDKNILERVTFSEEDNHRGNTFRELLRKLRYEIKNSNKQIFLFTSTEPQQGKTSLIQALAYSLSLGKRKVLIIDTNFCNNDLTVAINANPVLEEYTLNGKSFDKNDVNSLVTHTSVEGIDIIGCKGGDYTPSEILPKNHLLNYLAYLKEDYDYIFLEGAPLNGFTDSKELVSYADALIAIFSADTSLTEADKESILFLKENNKFLGVILNKVEEENLNM